jgi:DNA-binding PadR family transcriptional regulator
LLPAYYRYEYDKFIIDLAYENKTVWYRQMKREIDAKFGGNIHQDTLYHHIDNLIAHKYLESQDHGNLKKGPKKPYNLTNKTIQLYNLGILQIDFENTRYTIEDNSISEKLKKCYYIILSLIAFRQNQAENKGDFELQHIFNLMALKSEHSNYFDQNKNSYGITIDELISKLSGIFGYWHIVMNSYVMRKALTYLEKEGLVEERVIKGTSYYSLTNSIFKDFVIDCTGFFWNIQLRSRIKWQTISPPTPREKMFFDLFYGKDSNKSIENFKIALKQKKLDPNYKAIVKQNKDIISTLDNGLDEHYRMINRKYSTFLEEYPALGEIILEVFYPQYLRDEIGNIDKKYVLKDKKGRFLKDKDGNYLYMKYPEIIHSYSLDFMNY